MSNQKKQTRRRFLQTTAAAAASATVTPYFFTSKNLQADDSKTDRPILGCIGTGSRWGAVGPNAMRFGDCVAICDVDSTHTAKAANRVKQIQGKEPEIHEDYQRILDRKDIEVVTIVTPDHWHTKIAIEAMQAGKDVYCEKPLTLTIEEGKQIGKVQKETGRVFQVGTQQRSEMGLRFLQAVAMVHDGRIGDVKHVTCAIGGSPKSGLLKSTDPPSHLNWEKWLGQTPLVDYIPRRCHYEFRWWYEYSGGKMTDWGAHHIDIAQWAINQLGEGQGPTSVKPISATHPVPLKNGHPTRGDEYNAASAFQVECQFPNDVTLTIRDDTSNGIMFEGTKGRFFVSRGKIVGKPIEDLADKPLSEDVLTKLYKGKTPGGGNAHMKNFFDCIKTRDLPISDVFTHHRAMTTCHLANIAIRLNRTLKWDAKAEQVIGDADANAWQSRQQRKGYEIKV